LLRKDLARRVAGIVGSDAMILENAASGWPASVRVLTDDGEVPVALHVGPVGLSHRGRDAVERRFQNPDKNVPVSAQPHQIPVLLDVWDQEGPTVFVALDGTSRMGNVTRVSIFEPLALLRSAALSGWDEGNSSTGERLVAFTPSLLPIYIQLLRSGAQVAPGSLALVAAAAGLLSTEGTAPERGRRTASALIRDARFSGAVCDAYNRRCAMCGLNFSLVVGAHILPVAAAGAPDKVWNGLALCHNHHAAFDTHRIHVDSGSRRISMHPELLAGVEISPACAQFVGGTFKSLASPIDRAHLPHPMMFERRYDHFFDKYDWVA
jgi:hypothetical protein